MINGSRYVVYLTEALKLKRLEMSQLARDGLDRGSSALIDPLPWHSLA